MFALRYVDLPLTDVFNMLDPMNQMCAGAFWEHWGLNWWNPHIIEKRKKFREFYIEKHDQITQHFSLLEQSIKKEGIKRPLCVVTGPCRDKFLQNPKKHVYNFFPSHMISNPRNAVYTHTHGGSRLYIAEKLGLQTIPCAVHDFANLFPDAVEITRDNFRLWYDNDYVWVSQHNIRLVNRRHYHITHKSVYSAMNNHTRKAQKQAKEFAILQTKLLYNIK